MKNILSVVSILLFVSCFPASSYENNISSIEIATGYCNGECPFTAVKMDSSLNISFYGGEYADRKGYYSGKIKKNDWKYCVSLLDTIKFFNLNDRYQNTIDDQALEIIVTNEHKKNTLKHKVAVCQRR